MNKRMFVSFVLVASVSLVAMGLPVTATFDPQGTVPEATVTNYVPVDIYVIGKGVGDVVGWEIGMDIPAGFTVTNRLVSNGPGVNPSGADNYVIGLGACYGSPGADYLFITYNMGWFVPDPPPVDVTFCLRVPDANGAESGFVAYVNCANEILEMEYGNVSLCPGFNDGCALINPTVSCIVKNATASWGALKAAY